jgi:NADPH2 dehydrogenase
MAPLTRFRGTAAHLPGPDAKLYYEQRASTPGTLIITEANFVSARAGGYPFVPGIWNEKQVEVWKEITDAVHAHGSFIVLQIVATGRSANPAYLRSQGHDFVSPSPIAIDHDHEVPRALADEEISTFINDFAGAAKNAMLAGFDGVEIHGANGYLVDQFWQDVSNHREDRWGGSIENRARFGLEVTKAVIAAVGDSRKVGMRLSPWSTYQSMRMTDPVAQFLYVVKELKKLDLGYLHLFESRSSGSSADGIYQELNHENDVFVEAWGLESPLLLAGGYNDRKAARVLNELYPDHNICIVFGRQFLSNPDLPFRIRHGIDLNTYDRGTFYKFQSSEGYIDYPFSDEWLQVKGAIAKA